MIIMTMATMTIIINNEITIIIIIIIIIKIIIKTQVKSN